MSFSQKVKKELCEVRMRCRSCKKAQLYGFLLFSRGIAPDSFSITTESQAVAVFLPQEVVDQFGAIVTVHRPDLRDRSRRPSYTICVDDKNDTALLWRTFFSEAGKEYIDPSFFDSECCIFSFLRGAWLSCGTMSNPQKEYHFEFDPPDAQLGEDLLSLLQQLDMDFHCTLRGKQQVIYVKDSELIEDMLARMGAIKSSLELMNLKIEKGLRNQVNRITNCETANISKTVNASVTQIEKISYLQRNVGFDSLPPQLREVAELRLENPDASLRELCELSGGALSRSGLNHRLQKLCELADQQRKKGIGI